MSKISFVLDGIGHLISDNFFQVPIYQRPYSWKDENILDLLTDVKNSLSDDEYFIGTVVIKKLEGASELEIIDGQQRIATITIFFSALRDFMQNEGDQEGAKEIESNYLSKKVLRSRDIQPKLILGSNDNEFFKRNIVELLLPKDTPKKDSHKKILAAYEICLKFIKKEFAVNRSFDSIYDIIEFIKENVKVIVVTVPDDVNAFTIFEVLNDRGLKLSQIDLIKNYLFHKAGNRLNEARDKWTKFTGAIDSAVNEEEILQFVRYHWSSKYGLVREKELMRSIKEKIRNVSNTISYLTDIETEVNNYLAILNASHSFWKAKSPNSKEYINTLLELQLIQNRPLLLSLLKSFTDKELEKSLKLVVSWSVRNLITGSIGAGTLEKEFSNQAKLIRDGIVKTAAEFKKSISPFVPTDSSFKSQFSIATLSKSYIARYYLKEIEKTFHKTTEHTVTDNTEVVDLEHILPEKPNLVTDWPLFTEDDHKSYHKRLGNLTLMDKKLNSAQKNYSFLKKKPLYGDSEIIITKDLKKKNSWSKNEIDKRQKLFAEKALLIWTMKIS